MIKQNDALIKICGVRDAMAARTATEAGAAALGFMLAESRRRIDLNAIAPILARLPANRPLAVAVVVNESPASIERIIRESGIDLVQLSGDEPPEVLGDIDVPTWKALRFPAGTALDDASRKMDMWLDHARPVNAILVDAAVPGQFGGTGHTADWELTARLAERYPVILAGGLHSGNVGDAIEAVGPTGVDVSSGVEVDGTKNAGRIRAFIAAGTDAFARR